MRKSTRKVDAVEEVRAPRLGMMIHEAIRNAIELAVEEELQAALGAPRYVRTEQSFMTIMSNPTTKAHFNLTGVHPSALGAAARGASPIGGATEWELAMIRNNPEWWGRITWWNEGKIVANPFAP